MALVEAVHGEFPQLTYDVTIKIEHLLRHRKNLTMLRETGCLFVTSAVESVDDEVLCRLEKGHTQADFLEVNRIFRELAWFCTRPLCRSPRGRHSTATSSCCAFWA